MCSTVNVYPLKAIEEVCQGERRIGLGVQGLHSMLMDLGLTYDQPESFRFVGRLFNFIRNCAYEESISLAQEKGVFRYYSPQLLQSGYAKTLPKRIREGIQSMAYVTVPYLPSPLQAPLQWSAELLQVSSLFSRPSMYVEGGRAIHERSAWCSPRITSTIPTQPRVRMISTPGITSRCSGLSRGISTTRFQKRSTSPLITRWKNSPISGWNIFRHLKGTTFYRQGSRGFEPLEHVPAERVNEVLANWTGEIEYDGVDGQDCATGVCEV
jgi:hypothetical protein